MSKASGTGGDASFNIPEGMGCHVTWGSGWCAILPSHLLVSCFILLAFDPKFALVYPHPNRKEGVTNCVADSLQTAFFNFRYKRIRSNEPKSSQSPSFLQTSQQVPIKKIQNVSSRRLRKKTSRPSEELHKHQKILCFKKSTHKIFLPEKGLKLPFHRYRGDIRNLAPLRWWDGFLSSNSKNNLSNFQAFCRTHFLVQKVRKTWCIYSMKKNDVYIQWKNTHIYIYMWYYNHSHYMSFIRFPT